VRYLIDTDWIIDALDVAPDAGQILATLTTDGLARNRALLRRRGHRIPDLDLLIAATRWRTT
jgi:hypothetical protein